MRDYRDKDIDVGEIVKEHDKRALDILQFLVFTFLFGVALAVYAGNIGFKDSIEATKVIFITLLFLLFSFNLFSFYRNLSNDYGCNLKKAERTIIATFVFFNLSFFKQLNLDKINLLAYFIQLNSSFINTILFYENYFIRKDMFIFFANLLLFLLLYFLDFLTFIAISIALLLTLSFIYVFQYICNDLTEKLQDTREVNLQGI